MFNHAVILAAGRGIRLIYMTSRIPKALVDVCGMPLINYYINDLLDFTKNNTLKYETINLLILIIQH